MNQIHSQKISIWLILSIFLLMGFTYQNSPFSDDDQKKVEKAKELNLEAQKLIDKANSLYSEIAEYDDSDSQNSEKIEELKNKALEYQLKALELQKEANFIEYNVLIKNLTDLKLKYSINNDIPVELKILEEQAGESFYKAEKLRNEAYQLENNELDMHYSKLSGAQEHEISGLENLKKLKDIYSGNQAIEINKQSNSEASQDFKSVEINEALLQAFLNYLSQKDSFLTINSYYNILYSDSLSVSTIRNAWDDYLYSETRSAGIDYSDEKKPDASRNINEFNTNEVNQNIVQDNIEISTTETESDVIYKIQIPADKKQLPQHTLQKIYSENKILKMLTENGWYKYTIGDFKSFSDADIFRISLKVDDAFIVAYKNGITLDMAELLNDQNKSTSKKVTSNNSIEGLIFKVQIAADKIELSENQLANIYKGNEPIDMIEENGWYKYSIGKRETYEQAVTLNKSTNVAGSFIVAYKDGIKIPLNNARKGDLSLTVQNEKIVFKVQIAADKKQISSEKLHEIYSGYEKTGKFEEDGWYKYFIGEFNNFYEANEFRKKCNVKGAFVIAFKGDKKINVLEAKKSSICYDPIIHKDWIYTNSELVFKVQIAASLKELSNNNIKNICCVEANVYLTKENGWVKYSIGNFDLFQKAVELKKICGVEGAFIVAYLNGQKMNIKEAKELLKK